jgi:undecaprenyl-diphosphatase
MLEWIIEKDQELFFQINRYGTNDWLDIVLPLLREPLFWSPLYLFLLTFALFNFPKKAGWWLLSVVITIALTDQISSKIIKPLIGRLRPCNDPELSDYVRLLVNHCGQNGSFTSSHAANHFGMAMFFFLTLEKLTGKYRYLFFIWALAVCYAQVYVGVHFPLDVMGGALLGIFIGKFTSYFFIIKTGGISTDE